MGYEEIAFKKDSVFLVTGAAGFIGSNLVEALCRLGYKVKALDDFSNGKKANIDRLISEYQLDFAEGTVENIDTCRKMCEGVNYVLHQAAWGSVPRSMTMPLKYQQVNVNGTLNMLEAARENNITRFVYASSSSVYGDEVSLPKVEGKEGNLLSPYALTKRMNEEHAKLYWDLYHLPTIGLRYFNVFGRYQDAEGAYAAVIPKFIKMLLQGQAPQIYGDGQQSRDFTYIENVIEANLKACLAMEEAYGRAFNIAYGQRFTLNEMYESMTTLLEVDIEPQYIEARAGDIKHSLAAIGNAKEYLNYYPDWDFKKGFQATVSWYKENL